MANQIPLVDYLALGDAPHLTANECTACGARFFDRRNACASCSGTEFHTVDIETGGEVKAFTIIDPTPEHVALGMKVHLATYTIGTDDNGTEAIGFGFAPN